MTHLPDSDPSILPRYLKASGARRLNAWWAKAEILIGLAVATYGFVLLRDRTALDVVAGACVILGGYLAMGRTSSRC